jgi:hypothetical protein
VEEERETKESHFIQARRLNLAKENPEKKKQSNLDVFNRKKKKKRERERGAEAAAFLHVSERSNTGQWHWPVQYSHSSGSSMSRNAPPPTTSSSTAHDGGGPQHLRSARSRSGRSNSASSGLGSASSCGAPSEAEPPLSALGRGKSAAAARAAAACTSLGAAVAGRGSRRARPGKLRCASRAPLMASAATSCARAAISAVAKVPSQMRDFLRGSLISDTHLPQLRMRTPRYVGCRPPSLRARFFGDDDEEEEEEEDEDGDGDGEVGVAGSCASSVSMAAFDCLRSGGGGAVSCCWAGGDWGCRGAGRGEWRPGEWRLGDGEIGAGSGFYGTRYAAEAVGTWRKSGNIGRRPPSLFGAVASL